MKHNISTFEDFCKNSVSPKNVLTESVENTEFTCTVGVSVREMGGREIEELLKGFEEQSVEVIDRSPGHMGGDEDWILKGIRKNLEEALTAWGFDISQIEFEEW